MKINYDGREYNFDLEEIDLTQATIIKDKYGLTLMGLEEGLMNGDPAVLRSLYWVMLAQNGEPDDIERVNFKIVKFAKALDKAGTEEAAKSETPKDEGAESSPA